MNDEVTSQFYFDDYKIDNINFKFNTDFENQEVNVDFSTNFNLSISEEENSGMLNIIIEFWEETSKDEYPFELEISIIGFFSSSDNMNKEQFETMCKYNGAAILFPYLRSAITDITKVANFSSLVLPTLNIKKLVDQNL